MAKAMKMSSFFNTDLNENYLRARQSVRPEEVKSFSERETGVRKDHCGGKPNSSLTASSANSFQAAEMFLVSPKEEVHFFFNKFRRLYRLYRELKTK